VLLLHLFKGTNKVCDPSNPNMLGSASGCLCHRRSDRRRPSLRQNNSINSGSIGGPQQGPQIVWVFHSIESKEEPMLSVGRWSEQVLDSQESPLPNDRQHTLMRIRSGKPRELVPGFNRYADPGGPAECDQLFQAIVSTFAGHADMVKLSGS
jgi:hypothetical protein